MLASSSQRGAAALRKRASPPASATSSSITSRFERVATSDLGSRSLELSTASKMESSAERVYSTA
jgi:hypothetical protein